MTTPASDLRDSGDKGHAARRACLIAAVVAVIIAIHIAGRVGAYCSPLKNDSYVYAAFGYRIAHGDVLYRDMSDIKPPGLFMLFALVYLVGPASRSSIVPVESLFLLLSCYLIYRLSRQIYGGAVALVVAVVAVVTINYFTVMGHVIEGFGLAENFMVLPAVAAVLFYRRALLHPGGRPTALFVAGLLLGFDTSIKQTALAVVTAVAVHWSWSTLLVARTPRRWAKGCGWLLLGGLLAWSPFVVLMVVQGTWGTAWTLLTSDAGAMIGRGTAWPLQWREVLPLQLPLAWCLWALLWSLERRLRSRPSKSSHGVPPAVSLSDLVLLGIWCATESALLLVLPLRSAHYYVVACVPFILISGAPWAALSKSVERWPHRARLAVWSIAIVGSAALYRPAVDAIVPCAIARYRAYDWEADARYFERAVHSGRIHYGRGRPWRETDEQ